jgi:serine/threonine protein kinase
MTGSPRYMAPEMANSQPYNATCDCYSFAVLLWQILALKVPFGKHLTLAKLHLQVWTYPHERPALVAYEDTWPLDMHCLLKDAWTEEVVKRLSMDEISEILRDQVLKGRSGDGSKLEHSRRRSTHVFRPTSSAKARPFRRSSSDTNSSAFLAAMYGMGKANNNNNNNNKAQDSNDDDLSFSSQERIQIVSWAAPSD